MRPEQRYSPMTRKDVLRALSAVIDPERQHDIARLGMVRDIKVEDGRVSFSVHISRPGSAFAQTVADECRVAVREASAGPLEINIQVVTGAGAAPLRMGASFMIAVASGKGGVGKSTVAANLAVALAQEGYRTGLVDTDIYGPSVPTMLGVEGSRPRVNEDKKIVPLQSHGVRLLSMGLLVDASEAVIWRGPMVSSAVRQFLGQVAWGELDFLILDLPPGTGDIQLTIVQTVKLAGAVIVSTPQPVALADARKGVTMFEKVNVPILGMIENMAYFAPPDMPDRRYYLFGKHGARKLAKEMHIPFLAEIPLEQHVRESGDNGMPAVVAAPESAAGRAFHGAARGLAAQMAKGSETPAPEIDYR